MLFRSHYNHSETIEIFENWIEDAAIFLDGLPVISLDGMIIMKEKLGREKDQRDIRLIKEFRKAAAGGRLKLTMPRA